MSDAKQCIEGARVRGALTNDIREIYEIYLRIRLANRKCARKFWFCKLALTCVDLQVRLAGALDMKIFSRVFNSYLFVNY